MLDSIKALMGKPVREGDPEWDDSDCVELEDLQEIDDNPLADAMREAIAVMAKTAGNGEAIGILEMALAMNGAK